MENEEDDWEGGGKKIKPSENIHQSYTIRKKKISYEGGGREKSHTKVHNGKVAEEKNLIRAPMSAEQTKPCVGLLSGAYGHGDGGGPPQGCVLDGDQ